MTLDTCAARGHQLLYTAFPELAHIDEMTPFYYTNAQRALLSFISLSNSPNINDIFKDKTSQVFVGLSASNIITCLLETPILLKWYSNYLSHRTSEELGDLVKFFEKNSIIDPTIISFISVISLNKLLNKREQRLNN